jgi:pimeloyl-ACP methyl ester carboxylesterase
MSGWVERSIDIGGEPLVLLEAGEGRPLLILHDELGPADWQVWHDKAVAAGRKLVMPVLPGFRSDRLKWIRDVRDLASFLGRVLRAEKLVPVDVIGFSFGGWLAAEMAVANPGQFRKMALVAPFGLKPAEGYITDMFIVTSAEYIRMSFTDPAATPEFSALYGSPDPQTIEGWEDARRECAEIAWQPYMHSPSLDHLLRGVDGLPVLLLWGGRDAIVPESAMRAYEKALPRVEAKVFSGCGHRPELERREDFAAHLTRFLD